LIADLTGARPSTGWISSQLGAVANVLVDVEKLIKTLIVLAHVIHVDETTSNINGARWWLHVASTDKLTGYHLHRSRGRPAVTEFDVLPGYRGTVVHDALSVYDTYPRPGTRCAVHTWPVNSSPPPRPIPARSGPRRRYAPSTASSQPLMTPVISNYRRSHPRSPINSCDRGDTRCSSGSPLFH
jgi:hypothetical protein